MERRLRRARRDGKNARRPVNSWKTDRTDCRFVRPRADEKGLEMDEKKYELTDETKTLSDGTVLYRIRAARKFTIHDEITVRNGDLGGWIERENNLSHDGSAWVYGEAYVYGKARVFDDARVFIKAEIYGKAEVYGKA